ncbi:MAG: hypothetical protein J5544_00630 [Clostridia bacterium]|nr:hypothetical protein [Clostridia bacterium]
MEIQERTIYSKRFRTIEDDIRDIYREMGEDPRIKPAETEAAGPSPGDPPTAGAAKEAPGSAAELPDFSAFMLDYEPDETRVKAGELFIAKARRFSQKYKLSADITRDPGGVSVELYFSTDILFGKRKSDLIELFSLADEITGTPLPKGMEDWCDLAVTLHYWTHRCYRDGRALHPFD